MWEGLAVHVLETRMAGGLPGSRGSAFSPGNVSGLWSSVQGTTDMEMDRPWVLVGFNGMNGLLGEKAQLSCWSLELQ